MKLAITINGVRYDVTPKPGDLVRFERQFNVSAATLDENARLEYVFFIAWTAMHRTGDFTGDFEEFLDLADTVDGDAPLAPPTPPS